MPKAIITVGLGFGDEGKGTAVDYLCRKHDADLVVRYNGGHQAGHNVVLPDGTHHCFNQFGSGTFTGAKTYLGKHMIVDPERLITEAQSLSKKGIDHPLSRLYINSGCLVTTPWHKLLNQFKEILRNSGAHGTCGRGIGETKKYWLDYGLDAVQVKDFNYNWTNALDKLDAIRQRLIQSAIDFQKEMYETCNVPEHYRAAGYSKLREMYDISPIKWLRSNNVFIHPVQVIDCIPSKSNTMIFEGSQGILLDEQYGFHPHTTWSTTTSRYAYEELLVISNLEDVDTEVVGITRAYHTRHGNGPFPTGSSIQDTSKINNINEHNKVNYWQQEFKVGRLDLPLLNYALHCDNIDSLFVTCLDHVNEKLLTVAKSYEWKQKYIRAGLKLPDQFMTSGDFPSICINVNEQLGYLLDKVQPTQDFIDLNSYFHMYFPDTPIKYKSYGPTYKDKKEMK